MASRSPRRAARPQVEILESRVVPSTYVVNSVLDRPDLSPGNGVVNTATSGVRTLRAAIMEANAHAGPDTIRFNIPGAGPHTIRPTSPLPEIVTGMTIDGYSEPGAKAN